jgi:hypothetical protein
VCDSLLYWGDLYDQYREYEYDRQYREACLKEEKEFLARQNSFGAEPYVKEVPTKAFLKNCAEFRGRKGIRNKGLFKLWDGNPAPFAHDGCSLEEMRDAEGSWVVKRDRGHVNPHWGRMWSGRQKKMTKRDRGWMRKLYKKDRDRDEIGAKKCERVARARERGTVLITNTRECRGSSSRIPDDDNRKCPRAWERDTRPRRWLKGFTREEVGMWHRGVYTGVIGECSTNYEYRYCG